jgi:hypothetical protein
MEPAVIYSKPAVFRSAEDIGVAVPERMSGWLMSAQKLRWRPSVMISRPPSRTTRAFDVRSFWFVTIFFESREALQGI